MRVRREDGKWRFMDDEGWYHFDFMTLAWVGLFFVMICIGILLLALAHDVFTGGNVMQKVSAANYSYNMTKDELDELRLTELCYNLQKTNMAITVLDEFCRQTYGDIDSDYGDKMK